MGKSKLKRDLASRILLVEDHPIVRERMAEVIHAEPDLVVCGEAEDHRAALELVRSARPDLVIVDLSLKRSHGFDLLKDIRRDHPALPVLIFSIHDESLHAERAIHQGARGYISKHADPGQ